MRPTLNQGPIDCIDELCIAEGPWQVIMLSAALRQHQAGSCMSAGLILVVPYGSDDVESCMQHFAESLYAWRWIRIERELLPKKAPDIWPFPLKEMCEGLRMKYGAGGAPRRLWSTNIDGYETKLLLEAFDKVACCIYEDGMFSLRPYVQYVEKEKFSLARLLFILKARICGTWNTHCVTKRLFDWRTAVVYEKRIERVVTYLGHYYPLSASLSKSVQESISSEVLRGCFKDLLDNPEIFRDLSRAVAPAPGDILYLSQYYAEQGAMSWEDQLGLYIQTCKLLIERGYRVAWKEHPRSCRLFFPLLEKELGTGIYLVNYPASLPVEVCFMMAPFERTVSIASTSLLYIPHLFGKKTYSFASEGVQILNNETAREICRQIEAAVPSAYEISRVDS